MKDNSIVINKPAKPKTEAENLFHRFARKTEAQTKQKVLSACHRFFGIGTSESSTPAVDSGYRCYYELPQDPSMAFIWAADSNDIRSEGMSYGMMIAVQTDMKEQFDKLWKFTSIHMQHDAAVKDTPAAWHRYFRWQLADVDTTDPSEWRWDPQHLCSPAPDGEEYFAMALYLADRRWGSQGSVNYKAEADAITDALLHNPVSGARHPIFHSGSKMISFVPYGDSYEFTDPSYHLPAFYEWFALWGPPGNAENWLSIAELSRDFLAKSAHPETGLHPDYASFSGSPVKDVSGTPGDGLSGNGHDTFRHDAWRVPMNIALDAKWYGKDPRMKFHAEKYHEFFSNRKGESNVENSIFHLDGKNGCGEGSTALTAALAAASMVSGHPDADFWVQALWDVPQQSGEYRYYQECIYLLGMLHVSGMFALDWQ